MKKLLLFAVLAFTMGTRAHAQTNSETMNWLDAKLRPAMYFSVIAGDTIIGTSMMTSHTMIFLKGNSTEFDGFADSIAVPFDKLTDVSIKPGFENVGGSQVPVISLILTGKVYQTIKGQSTQTVPFAAIDLNSSTPPETVNSIVKALKHLAQLNGAKMVNDDLFK